MNYTVTDIEDVPPPAVYGPVPPSNMKQITLQPETHPNDGMIILICTDKYAEGIEIGSTIYINKEPD